MFIQEDLLQSWGLGELECQSVGEMKTQPKQSSQIQFWFRWEKIVMTEVS
jgi:hypothetical protein